MMPEIIGSLYGLEKQFMENLSATASPINSRKASVFWESERNMDFLYAFLKRKHLVESDNVPNLLEWIKKFDADKQEAVISFREEMHKGTQESLREF